MKSSNKSSVVISVPASSANLGPGFDCLALALDIRLRAEVNWGRDTVKLRDFSGPLGWWHQAVQPYTEFSGTLSPFAESHTDEPNFLAVSFVKAVVNVGPEYHLPSRLVCKIHSDIPIGQGLGSSAAANVAGAAVALYWRSGELKHDAAFDAAVEIEGHADNAAAAVYGGLQAALLFDSKAKARHLPVHESLKVALAVPRESLKQNTGATRRWLPEQVRRTEAASNQRVLMTLLYGLETGDRDAIAAGFEDRLHVPHRKGMVQGFDDIVAAAVEAGAFGATLSGAGGAILAVGVGDMRPAAEAMCEMMARYDIAADPWLPAIDKRGVLLEG